MRYIIHYLKRLGISGWLFVAGFTAAAVLLVSITDTVSRIQKEFADKNDYAKSVIYQLAPDDSGAYIGREDYIVSQLISQLTESECCTEFFLLPVEVNHQIQDMESYLIMSADDGLKLRSLDKKAIDGNSAGKNTVFAGESILTLSDNKRELNIGENAIAIQEILENNNPAGIDYSLVLFWDSADDNLRSYLNYAIKERLEYGFLTIRFFSDNDIERDVDRFLAKIDELPLTCTVFVPPAFNSLSSMWYSLFNAITMPLCLIFSLFTCFVVSEAFIGAREREIAVRKAYGYSDIGIVMFLIKEFSLLSLLPVVFAVVFHAADCIIFLSFENFDGTLPLRVLAVYGGMLLFVILSVLRQIMRIRKIQPAQVIKEG